MHAMQALKPKCMQLASGGSPARLLSLLLACLCCVCPTAAWPFHLPLPAELNGVTSSWSCQPIQPWQHPNRTVCEFRNIIVFNGMLWLLGEQNETMAPQIAREWWLPHVTYGFRNVRRQVFDMLFIWTLKLMSCYQLMASPGLQAGIHGP